MMVWKMMTTMILFLLMVVAVVVDVVLLVVGGVPGVAVAAGLNPLLLSADTTTTAPFTRSTTPILQSLVLCYRTTSSSTTTTTTRSSIPPNLYHHQADATHVDVQLGTTTSSSSSSLSSRRNRSCVLVDHIIAIQPGGGGDDNGGGTPQQTEATTTTWTTPQHPQQQEPHQRPPPQTTTRRPTIAMTSTRSSTTTDDSTTTTTTNLTTIPWMDPQPPPHPPRQLPLRFLRAGKGNVQEAIRRYQATLAWRRQEGMDAILREANPFFPLIKRYYPHYYHGRGYHGEPCFYEQPAQTNLPALRKAGVTLPRLLRHYAMVTEFQWQYLVQHDDLAKSIYVIDLEGLKLTDFAGPVVAYIKSACALSAQHYPERAGVVFVINVPAWFQLIWKVVKQWIDEATLQKIFILRNNQKDEIRRCLQQKIPPHALPREYGGQSPYPLGQSPEEKEFAQLVEHNNRCAAGDRSCGGAAPGSPCRFCTWVPPRSY